MEDCFLATVRDRAMEGFVDGTEERLLTPKLTIFEDFYIPLPPELSNWSSESNNSTQIVVLKEDEEIVV